MPNIFDTTKQISPNKISLYTFNSSTNGTNNFSISISGLTEYVLGQKISFKADVASTGACTLNINSLGAITIKKNFNIDLQTNDIKSGQIVTVVYDGTYFQMQSQLGNVTSTSTGSSKWSSLTASTDFSTTAASTSTITMVTDQTANISPGMAIKFTLSGTVYYAICSAITSSLLTISGAPLTTTASALTALSYSIFPGMVEELVFSICGPWADNVDTSLLENDLNSYFYWTKAPAYLVKIDAITKTTDSSGTAFPRVNARIGTTTSNYISTSNSNAGLSLAASATKYSTTVDISSAMYAISNDSRIEIKTDANGTNLDASDLTIILTIVFA